MAGENLIVCKYRAVPQGSLKGAGRKILFYGVEIYFIDRIRINGGISVRVLFIIVSLNILLIPAYLLQIRRNEIGRAQQYFFLYR